MTTELVPGANTAVPSGSLSVQITLPGGAEIDSSALLLNAEGKVRSDADMCFYNQPSVCNGAVKISGAAPNVAYAFDFARLDADVQKIVLTATIDGAATFGSLGAVRLEAPGAFRAEIPSAGRTEKALILGEFYLRNGAWKFRLLAQGFNGGLAALATHFGVDIADDPAPAPAPAAAPAPERRQSAPPAGGGASVNLSKVSLTKNENSISLSKADGRFGKIRVNLDWNQKKSGGFLGLGSKGIDLDVGAMIESRHGQIALIQALGNAFGDFGQPPFVKLLGDDRTGAVSGGEWLEINGDHWGDFKRILIYTFIYSGAVNWRETDGVVRVLVPNQPEVEVKMNEYGSTLPACAIAMLENVNGQIRVTREVEFFESQKPMDERYGFGFEWRAGRK